MASLDINTFLIDVKADSPCGENLEHDSQFQEMERLAKGKPESQFSEAVEPDWKSVRKLALEILKKTRDVRVAVLVTHAAANLNDLEGVRWGLALIHGLLKQHWRCIYPVQDEEDPFPERRMNVLAELNSANNFLHPLRRIVLTNSRNFRVCLRDIDIASGKVKSRGENDEPMDESQIQAAFKDSDPDYLRSTQEHVDAALTAVQEILTVTKEGLTPEYEEHAPNLSELEALFGEIGKVLRDHVPQEIMGDKETENQQIKDAKSVIISQREAKPKGTVVHALEVINNRNDVARAIDLICAYYDLHEPTSPVPLLMKRAKRLLQKDFIEILQDIAPDGVKQAETVCSPEKEGEN